MKTKTAHYSLDESGTMQIRRQANRPPFGRLVVQPATSAKPFVVLIKLAAERPYRNRPYQPISQHVRFFAFESDARQLADRYARFTGHLLKKAETAAAVEPTAAVETTANV